MKLQWLGDIKDEFKFSVCLSVMECLELKNLLWVMMLTDKCEANKHKSLNSECVYQSLRNLMKCLQKERIRYNRAIRKFMEDLEKKLKEQMSVNIVLIKDEFNKSKSRDKYFEQVRYKICSLGENMLIFLDPDTGFEPKKAERKHVKYKEVKEIFETMNAKSILVVFQHWRRGQKDSDIIEDISRRLEKHNLLESAVCLYTRKAEVIMFLFFKNSYFKSKVIECIKSTKCFRKKESLAVKNCFEFIE